MRQQLQTAKGSAGAAPADGSESLATQLEHLSEEVLSHFRQQIRFQGRLVLGTLAQSMNWQVALSHLDRFTSRAAEGDAGGHRGPRRGGDSGDACLKRDGGYRRHGTCADCSLRLGFDEASGFANAVLASKQEILQHAIRTVESLQDSLRLAIATHEAQPRNAYDDQWLGGEALRLLNCTFDGWLEGL